MRYNLASMHRGWGVQPVTCVVARQGGDVSLTMRGSGSILSPVRENSSQTKHEVNGLKLYTLNIKRHIFFNQVRKLLLNLYWTGANRLGPSRKTLTQAGLWKTLTRL